MIFSLTLLILFHQSFCQVGIQEDIASICPTNKSEAAINEYCQTTNTKIGFLEKKVGDILDLLTSIKLAFGCPVCRSGYEYYQQDKFCYKFHIDCKNWSEARQVCREEGGDLISLNNQNLNFFRELALEKSGSCDHVWVGTTDIFLEGQWNWLNGDAVSFASWAPGQPDDWDLIENCGDLNKNLDYRLNDEDCSRKLHFLCQDIRGKDRLYWIKGMKLCKVVKIMMTKRTKGKLSL